LYVKYGLAVVTVSLFCLEQW